VKKHHAFTLIELLVVIAIIVLLVSILLPTLGWIEQLKTETHCQKNLKEIGKAFSAYCTMNKGRYPYKIDTYYGQSFSGQDYQGDAWAIFPHLLQLKQVGARPEIFYCPFDPIYGNWNAWPASTWAAPRVYKRWNSTKYDAVVYIGYTMLTYRSYPYNTAQFDDGRYPIISDKGEDDIPVVADRLWYRAGGSLKGGWFHGGGGVEGLFNSDCNTLFKGGYVVHTDAGQFDWGTPSITVGSATDLWWFALGR